MATLKISDLSVGDWVKMEDEHYQIYHLTLAGDVYGYRKVNITSSEEYFDGTIADVCPIPITPEILEANGWKCIEEDADDAFYGDPTSSLFHTKGTFRYNFATPEVSIVCHFVHQLQHALRLAGIDREIVMPNK